MTVTLFDYLTDAQKVTIAHALVKRDAFNRSTHVNPSRWDLIGSFTYCSACDTLRVNTGAYDTHQYRHGGAGYSQTHALYVVIRNPTAVLAYAESHPKEVPA